MAKLSEPEKLLRIWIDTVEQGEPVVMNGAKMKVVFGPWGRRFAVIGPSSEGIDTVEVIPLDERLKDNQHSVLHIVKDYFRKLEAAQ
jgi:hypothetical protein